MGIAISTIIWFYVWLEIEPTSAFQIALAPPYVVLVNIMICRVFRNTKLGLYSKVPLPSNDSKPQPRNSLVGTVSWNSRHDATDTAMTPIQISVNQVVEYKCDYPPGLVKSKRPADYLDFGMV